MNPAVRVILAHLQDPCCMWLETAIEHGTEDELRRRFWAAGSMARGPAAEFAGEPAWLFEGASAAELVRVCLVLCAMERTADPRALARDWYRIGDDDDKRAIMRAIPLGDRPDQHAHLAAIACRSTDQKVFESICCENPYPSLYFGDAAFSQMVLKADFTGISLDRIIGIEQRRGVGQRRSGVHAQVGRAA